MAPSATLLRAAAMAFVGIVASGRELDKCAACHVAMTSLERVLALEHLDEDKTDILAGGRLDSKGERQGKVVKYEASEFRTSHLIDQICEYALTYRPSKEGPRWRQNATLAKRFETNLAGKTKRPLPKISKATTESEVLRLGLLSHCGMLVEEHEELLAELIVAGTAASADGRAAICRDAARCCDDEGLARADTYVEDEPAEDAAADAPRKRKKKKRSAKKREL